MDGNGRWAKARGLKRYDGHKKGVETALDIVQQCANNLPEVKELTFWVFSSENWNRSTIEVNGLMSLFEFYISSRTSDLVKNNICVKFIGEFSRVPKKLRGFMEKLEQQSSQNTGLKLYIALSYGGKNEIISACKKIAKKYKSGEFDIDELDEASFRKMFYAPEATDPDLLIRTSGEQRLSNFLLWQLAYTEFYFTKTYWPDFNLAELKEAIENFYTRERRYGKEVATS